MSGVIETKMIPEDRGHKQLLVDLEFILSEAKNFQYHDFRNEAYATPKIELVNHLSKVIENAKQGLYDNKSV